MQRSYNSSGPIYILRHVVWLPERRNPSFRNVKKGCFNRFNRLLGFLSFNCLFFNSCQKIRFRGTMGGISHRVDIYMYFITLHNRL